MCRLSIFYSVFGPRVELDAICAETMRPVEAELASLGFDADESQSDLRDARIERAHDLHDSEVRRFERGE